MHAPLSHPWKIIFGFPPRRTDERATPTSPGLLDARYSSARTALHQADPSVMFWDPHAFVAGPPTTSPMTMSKFLLPLPQINDLGKLVNFARLFFASFCFYVLVLGRFLEGFWPALGQHHADAETT